MQLTLTEQELVIDLIDSVVDIGELAKLGMKLNHEAHVELEGDGDDLSRYQVRLTLTSVSEPRGDEALTDLAVLVAYCRGWSGKQMLKDLEVRLRRRGFPIDKPIQDVMSIGGGA